MEFAYTDSNLKGDVMRKKLGFTLIELLIVVAIIAILAAIAVPNFLEAQTRSKVSRMKSDMRTYATAFETYAVDHNRPPMGGWECTAVTGWKLNTPGEGDKMFYWIFGRLTTPVAYMTSIPLQVFVEKGGVGVNPNDIYRKGYTYGAFVTDQIHGVNIPAGSRAVYDKFKELGKTWYLAGYGPSRDFAGAPANGVAMIPDAQANSGLGYTSAFYDPTNGTVSGGYIMRSSAGIEPVR